MLECYFDDSGTHEGSRVAVWAGVVGHTDEFEALDVAWRRLLAKPLPGKPPLRQFHLSHCVNALGEFRDYRPAERDLVRNLFRTAIAEAGVTPISYAVDVQAWDRHVTGLLRRLVGAAENNAFAECAKFALQLAVKAKENIAIQFDQGRFGVALNTMIEGAKLLLPEAERLATFSFESCAASTGLQAADTVAYESYRFNLDWLDNPGAQPNVQFQHLLDRLGAAFGFILDEPAIVKMVQKMQPFVEEVREGLET